MSDPIVDPEQELTPVSVWPYVAIYFSVYISLLAGRCLLIELFELNSKFPMEILTMAFSVGWVRWKFRREHHRQFLKTEYRNLILLSLLIHYTFQVAMLWVLIPSSIVFGPKLPGLILILLGESLVFFIGYSPWPSRFGATVVPKSS